jgi:hypothetical protein
VQSTLRAVPAKGGPTWRVQFMLVNTNVLDPVLVLRRSSQQEIRVVAECGGLTLLSFCVSFGFCEIAVGRAERKKGTAKAASSHRTPKKANRPDTFFEEITPLPEAMTRGKRSVTIRFQTHPGNWAGGVFGVRIMRQPSEESPQ